jgi:hypothetical protein
MIQKPQKAVMDRYTDEGPIWAVHCTFAAGQGNVGGGAAVAHALGGKQTIAASGMKVPFADKPDLRRSSINRLDRPSAVVHNHITEVRNSRLPDLEMLVKNRLRA